MSAPSGFGGTFPWRDCATALLGEPDDDRRHELRYGSRGSLAVSERGWYDFEAGEGGGYLALVERVRGGGKAAAVAWMVDAGFLPRRERDPRKAPVGAVNRHNARARSAGAAAVEVEEPTRGRDEWGEARERLARRLWSVSVEPPPLAYAYLARRGVRPADGSGLPGDCRWVDAAAVARPWPPGGWHGLPPGAAGAFVFALRVAPEPAGGPPPAVSLLAVSGTAERVPWPIPSGRDPVKVMTVGASRGRGFHACVAAGPIHLVEGPVSALAVLWLPPDLLAPAGRGSVLAVGSSGEAEGFVWRLGGPIVLHVEGDAAGRRAARKCAVAGEGRVAPEWYGPGEDPADRLAAWWAESEGGGEADGGDEVPW